MFDPVSIQTQQIFLPDTRVELFIRREDKIHPFISGNKYRKLKYNLLKAKDMGCTTLLTFGGAYSNHIAAVAAAGCEYGFSTVGIIRGDELKDNYSGNPTLEFAERMGMQLEFISREEYRSKSESANVEKWQQQYPNAYFIPEGGSNELAVKGCSEILNSEDSIYDFICCPVGTGATVAGLINNSNKIQTILGFPVLQGDFLQSDIRKFVVNDNWQLVPNYHFGGYAKIDLALVTFINRFSSEHKVLLDPIYTAKMAYGVIDLIKNNFFADGSKILMIHTGGMQGIAGMNAKLANKKLPLIEINV